MGANEILLIVNQGRGDEMPGIIITDPGPDPDKPEPAPADFCRFAQEIICKRLRKE
jgi:hypothetical protein